MASGSSSLSLYRRLFVQMWPYRPHWLGLSLLALLSTPLGLLAPLPLKIAVDCAIGTQPLPHALAVLAPGSRPASVGVVLALAAILLVAIAAARQLQDLASTWVRTYTGEKLTLEFRAQVFRHAQRLSISYHDTKGTADSSYRIQADTAAVQYIFIDGAIPFVNSFLTLLAMLYITARIDRQLVLVALLIAPVLFLLSQKFRPQFSQTSKDVKRLDSAAWSIVQEVLSTIRVVKAFGREDHEQERYLRRSREGVQAKLGQTVLEGSYSLYVGLTVAIGTAAVLCLGARHVRAGILTLGDLLLVISYIGQLYAPLTTIGKKASGMQSYLASAERAYALLDQAPDVEERPNARPLIRAKGRVSFREVCFAYQPGRVVLHDISFEVPAGARVGIAGRTGAGKTTLLSLLTRFYDPASGQILLDGVDLRDYKLADLRNQFALVLQEPVLFSTSIAENIAYARPAASDEEIIEAAKLANAHDFISRLPEGYQTQVGERGMRLSGGERQRISVARAFLKDAPILLLDEPTSSVDLKTESAIMEAMERLMNGRTTIIIAHRLSTLGDCDLRIEIELGQLVAVREAAPRHHFDAHSLAAAGVPSGRV